MGVAMVEPAPIEFMPNSSTPAPRLMTAEEASEYLRLTDGDRNRGAGVKSLNRFVDKGLIRPCLVGRYRRYSRRELDRYIDSATERYGELA